MIKIGLLAAIMLACGSAEAQLLKPDEVITILPGRWEYRAADGWERNKNVSRQPPSCDGSAERIWFARENGVLIYYSQRENDPKKSRSPVHIDKFLFFKSPTIRLQYDGEKRLDPQGKPVAWEVYMTDRDTFYWHRVDWPLGGTTGAVRRCKETPVS